MSIITIQNKSMDTIFDLVKARFTVIWVRSPEESRVLDLFKSRIPDLQASSKTLWTWSCTEGFLCLSDKTGKKDNKDMTEVDTALQEIIKQIPSTKEDGKIWILKDFHPFLNNPITSRLIRDAAHLLLESRSTIILLSNSGTVPADLEGDITLVDFDLPTVEEIVGIVRDRVKAAQEAKILDRTATYDEARIRRHAEACLGMTASQIEGAISRSLITRRSIDVSFLLREKEDVVKKAGLLEFQQPDTDMASGGGLDLLKDWLVMRADSFTPEAHAYGLPNPRGVLLAGVPGCGKSLCAKAIGGLLELPILRMDVGRMFAGVVGESEGNMRRAIKLAEAIAPCVLWIDEIEKGMSGLGSSNMTDGGTSARVFGTFIHWMQEKQVPVFVVATANEVNALPPELLRKGRFDEIFFVDLPSKQEREEIFNIHISKRKRDVKNYDVSALVRETEGWSGAEIEQAVLSAMYSAFSEKVDGKPREFTTADILAAVQASVPLSVTRKEEIKTLREWAKQRARPTSAEPVQENQGARRVLEM